MKDDEVLGGEEENEELGTKLDEIGVKVFGELL